MTSVQIPTSVINRFEVIAAHLTHVFYNELYSAAHTASTQNSGLSITDAYTSYLRTYYSGMVSKGTSVQWFRQLILHLKMQLERYLGTQYITTQECIETITSAFVPEDFLGTLTAEDKSTVVHTCLGDVIGEMINSLSGEHLRMIIDDHNNRSNVGVIKDAFIIAMISQRDKMMTKFTAGNTRETRVTADVATARRLRDELNRVTAENRQLQESLRSQVESATYSLKQEVAVLQRDVSELQIQLDAERGLSRQLAAKNEDLKKKALTLIDQVKKSEQARRSSPPPYQSHQSHQAHQPPVAQSAMPSLQYRPITASQSRRSPPNLPDSDRTGLRFMNQPSLSPPPQPSQPVDKSETMSETPRTFGWMTEPPPAPTSPRGASEPEAEGPSLFPEPDDSAVIQRRRNFTDLAENFGD